MEFSQQRLRELLDRYLRGTATPGEIELLDRFFDSYGGGKDERRIDDKLGAEILEEVHSRVGHRPEKTNARVWWSLAAVIALFAIAWFFVDDLSTPNAEHPSAALVEEKSAAGEKLIANLPDGSRVYLNGNSKILYPKDFPDGRREVVLEGEGYFEVVTDSRPFLVRAGSMHTEVLGTSFNVEMREGANVEVTLVEGKVNVVAPSGRSLILEPNQQATVNLHGGEITKADVNVQRFTSWKDNTLFFEQTSLKEAIAEVERWYGVKIEILNPQLNKCRITAKYHNEPLGNVLSSFQFLLNLKIERTDDTRFSIDGKSICK